MNRLMPLLKKVFQKMYKEPVKTFKKICEQYSLNLHKGTFLPHALGNSSIDPNMYKMIPSARPLRGEYKKTVIIVTGDSMIGKSTLCDLILNSSINYISIDETCLQSDHNIKDIIDFLKYYDDKSIDNIHLLSEVINKKCYKEFVDYFVDKYILKNENMNILLDGYLFTYQNIYDYFLQRCENFRVWEIKRIDAGYQRKT